MKLIKHTEAPSTDKQLLNAGFTLIELMVTVAVLGIIVSLAAPSIGTQLANARVKSTAATLSDALAEAKSESVILRKSVMVSYSNNSDAVGIISIEVEAPNLTAYAGPALYFATTPTGSGTGSGSTGTGSGSTGTGSGSTGSGGADTGGADTGGADTGGTDTGGTDTGGTGSIPAPTVSYGVVKVYDYSAKITIQAASKATVFRPNRNVDAAMVYTICDANTSAKAMQVTVSSVGIISKKVGGSCTAS